MSFKAEHFMGCITEDGRFVPYRPMKKSERDIAIAAYSRYMHEKHKTLFDVYKVPSEAKKAVWVYWESVREKVNGLALSVISHRAQVFTVGLIVTCYGRDYFAYITPSKHYMLDITRVWEVAYDVNGTVCTDRFPYLKVTEKGVYYFASQVSNGIAYLSLALTRDQMRSLQRVPTIQV